MVLTIQYWRNVIIISFLRKLTFVFPFLQVVCEFWDYRKDNIESVQKAFQTFYWIKAFGNLSVDGKIDVPNEA